MSHSVRRLFSVILVVFLCMGNVSADDSKTSGDKSKSPSTNEPSTTEIVVTDWEKGTWDDKVGKKVVVKTFETAKNGLITFVFEPDFVKLHDIKVYATMYSVDVDSNNGLVSVVYLRDEKLQDNETLVELYMSVSVKEPSKFSVVTKQRNKHLMLNDVKTIVVNAHVWKAAGVRWQRISGVLKAYMCYECTNCGIKCEQEMKVYGMKKAPVKFGYEYIYAYLPADVALDGREHKVYYAKQPFELVSADVVVPAPSPIPCPIIHQD